MENHIPTELTPALYPEFRKIICVHEAAHAVVFAYGGATVYRVAVAPLGAKEWKTTGKKGAVLNDLWGLCSVSETKTYGCLVWNRYEMSFSADRKKFASLLRHISSMTNGFGRSARRAIRASVCGTLAGPISQEILRGSPEEVGIESIAPGDDFMIADGLCRLLPYRNELDHLAGVTERYLRQPDVWSQVLALADQLYLDGSLDDQIEGYLPDANWQWPSAPPRRNTAA